jgi:hypothetical protein
MISFPGSGPEQGVPESLKPIINAISTAEEEGVLLEVLWHFKSWEFEEKVRAVPHIGATDGGSSERGGP